MQKLNLNLTQRVALWWLKSVDRSLVIFKLLKDLSFIGRLLFYAGIIGYTIFVMTILSLLFGYFLNYENAPAFWQLMVDIIGDIIFYGVIVGMMLILTLESVIKLDVNQTIAVMKQQKQELKSQKLQKWRLRNMNIFMRIFIYISFYILMLFIIQTSALGAFIQLFATAPDTQEAQNQITLFMSEYNKFEQWYTFIYIISSLTLDYFVIKNRGKRRMEAQNETV